MKIQPINVLRHLLRRKRQVYLDHNATTSISKAVRRKMKHVIKNAYGNPSALYGIARKSTEIIEESRQQLADNIHADAEEIYFTGCATESNNTVLKSLSTYYYPKKKKIIATPIEHPSVINTLEFLKTQGIIVNYCPVDPWGRLVLEELEKLINEDTFLICCMLVNNEIGTIQNMQAITRIARKYDILVLSDCVQALGKIPVDVHELGIDYASFSAHKLHGPKGVGALYVKQWSPFVPFMHGGHQESGMRAGTESIHNIAGFGIACRDVNRQVAKSEHILHLKNQFIHQIQEIFNDCIVNSPDIDCIANTISISFPGIPNSALMALLDYHGIAVSGGSACSSEEDKPSHVLMAIGLSHQLADETIRISFGPEITASDIRYTLRVFRKCIKDKSLLVELTSSEELDKYMLFDKQTFIVDVRPSILRRTLKSLPNSHEVSFFSIGKYLKQFPKDKHILMVCQHGNLSYIATHFLKSKGFKQVSSLSAGLVGWRKQNSELYKEYAGQNSTALHPTR